MFVTEETRRKQYEQAEKNARAIRLPWPPPFVVIVDVECILPQAFRPSQGGPVMLPPLSVGSCAAPLEDLLTRGACVIGITSKVSWGSGALVLTHSLLLSPH